MYVKWFTPFQPRPEANSRLYKVSQVHRGDARMASIIPVGNTYYSKYSSHPYSWQHDGARLEQCYGH